MNKDLISDVFDRIIFRNKLIPDINVKCSPSSRESYVKSFRKYGESFGLRMIPNSDDDTVFTFMDEEHGTLLKFGKTFINRDNIDIYDEDKKSINITDVFEAYMNLPDDNKDSVNIINFTTRLDKNVEEDTMAYSEFISPMNRETNVITIPDYLFNSDSIGINYERTLAHESMHCKNYPKIDEGTHESIVNVLNGGREPSDILTFMEYNLRSKLELFENNNSDFTVSVSDNLNYLQEKNTLSSRKDINDLNKSSDYGDSVLFEDYAEAGSMVITGWRNPDNLNSVVKYDGRSVQFREWITIHPYQTKVLVKELYGEDVSIDTILGMGISSEYVSDTRSINDLLGGLLG